jgi:hypothetical protein
LPLELTRSHGRSSKLLEERPLEIVASESGWMWVDYADDKAELGSGEAYRLRQV